MSKMIEEWRDVAGYEGIYQVSDWGRVKNSRGRLLKPANAGIGYLHVILHCKGKPESCYLHRLVAGAFLANPNNHPQVNHINEDKHDNHAWNLQWCDAKHNANWHDKPRRMMKPVNQLTMDGKLIRTWCGMSAVTQGLGYDQGNIAHCCQGRYGHAYGYRWQYA